MPPRSANPPASRNRPPITPDSYVDPQGRVRNVVRVRMMRYDPETGEQLGMVDTWAPKDERRCTANARNGEFQKQRCRMFRMKGAPVCYRHGGNIPNVKKAAARRLALAAFPAAEKLIGIALTKRGVKDADRIRAICEVLDRAGI